MGVMAANCCAMEALHAKSNESGMSFGLSMDSLSVVDDCHNTTSSTLFGDCFHIDTTLPKDTKTCGCVSSRQCVEHKLSPQLTIQKCVLS